MQDIWLKLARVIDHFSINPINYYVETTQILLHKLGKLEPVNTNFTFGLETALTFWMRGQNS